MVEYNTPLMLRPTVAAESLPNIYQQVETGRALENNNIDTLARRNALLEYADRKQQGDPNATNALDTQPQLLAQVTQARNAMSQEQRTKFDFDMSHRARVALAVSAYPAGSVERQKAWDEGLKELFQVGALPSEKYREMVGKPPNDLVLQQYQMMGGLDFIKQARMDASSKRHAAALAGDSAAPATGAAPAAAPAAAAAPSPAAAAGFRPGVIPTPFGAPAAQPQPAAGLTPAAPVASPLRPAVASAPAPAPAAAPPAAPQTAFPAAADAATAGGAAVTPSAERPAAGADTGQWDLSKLPQPGNAQARSRLQKLEDILVDRFADPDLKKFAEKEYDRLAKELELTNDQKDYRLDMIQRAALRDPNKPIITLGDWQMEQNAKKATNVSQNIEAAGGKVVAADLAKRYGGAQQRALDAASTINLYETMDKLLSDPAVYTGTAAGPISELKKAGTTLLGLNLAGVANAEVAKKITTELAAQFKAMSKDPQTSTYEQRVYERLATGIDESAQGRKLMIALRVNDLEYQKEIAKTFRNYIRENGDIDPKVDDALMKLAEKRRNTLGEILEKANEVAAKTPQPQPNAGVNISPTDALRSIQERYKLNSPGAAAPPSGAQ